MRPTSYALLLALLALIVAPAVGNDELAATFQHSVRPFINKYCVECHQKDAPEGDLDLASEQGLADVADHFRRWMSVMDRLESGEMPPEEISPQPSNTERKQVIDWIADFRRIEAERRSGDPGIVLARRLSNAEYNNTIRDLTGFDLQPANSFPIDPANQEGFDNTGESLTMSPSLLKKYLQAANDVADHLVLTPSGINFAPHPAVTATDRDKYCVNRIISFYDRQQTDFVVFLRTLWQFENRVELGISPDSTIEEFAQSHGVSVRYLKTLRDMIVVGSVPQPSDGPESELGPIVALRIMWNQLQQDRGKTNLQQAEKGFRRLGDFIVTLRQQLVPKIDNLTTPEVHKGSQPLVLWKNRQFVANRRRYTGGALELSNLGLDPDSPEWKAMQVPTGQEQKKEYEDSFHQFCSVFPDEFVVSQRARVYLDPKAEKERTGRLLSAGFHSQMGYFRDDGPLYELILDKASRHELDRLWLELDFVTSAPTRQYTGFIWFDRTDSRFMRDSQFDRFRAEDKDCTSHAKVNALAKEYLSKAERVGGNTDALEAIRFYFQDMDRTFRKLDRLHKESERRHLDSVVDFAGRAFRRPLSAHQEQAIRSFYTRLRREHGLGHDAAIRDSIIAILMSPNFCFRLDASATDRQAKQAEDDIKPLDSFDLASRLSYFLWSTMPDDELISLASQGRLTETQVLKAQVKRMLADKRSIDFIRDFTGSWLGHRQFRQHNGVAKDQFPQFTDGLRDSMYQEPVRLFVEIVQNDQSILDLLYADYTFVNAALANHYEIPVNRTKSDNEGWVKVDDASRYGRGGILPMAVFLTQNSPGRRTSPVKRGNWIVKQVLGEHIPAPPATVPELPSDESELGDLTLRQTLEKHRENPSCAACHDRIDSFGLVFEHYGPIGERRKHDLGGNQVDSRVAFPDGSNGNGVDGLKEYIRSRRQADFLDNLCRKLLSYGLGRSLQLSDEPAIDEMIAQLTASDYRLQTLIETIVTSEPFLKKRTRAEL